MIEYGTITRTSVRTRKTVKTEPCNAYTILIMCTYLLVKIVHALCTWNVSHKTITQSCIRETQIMSPYIHIQRTGRSNDGYRYYWVRRCGEKVEQSCTISSSPSARNLLISVAMLCNQTHIHNTHNTRHFDGMTHFWPNDIYKIREIRIVRHCIENVFCQPLASQPIFERLFTRLHEYYEHIHMKHSFNTFFIVNVYDRPITRMIACAVCSNGTKRDDSIWPRLCVFVWTGTKAAPANVVAALCGRFVFSLCWLCWCW